jgi:peptide/nickel transport system permease protein
MSMRSFLLKRVAYTLILIGFVLVFNFIIFEAMPGEVGALYACLGQPRIPPATCLKLMQEFGYGQPVWVRFYDYVKAMVTFNFGISFANGQDVLYQILNTGRLANTLLLIGSSTVMAIIIGTVSGVIVSRKRGSSLDNFSVVSSLTTFSLPTFFTGILLIFVFAISLNWFPPGGTYPNRWDITGPPPLLQQISIRLWYLFLPALTLTIFAYGGFLLLTRATMMEALSEDYILTARAKGLSERTVLFKHAFKNASLPLVTNVALSFGFILSGAIITETLFDWNGLGKWLFDSIGYKDFPVMQAMFFLIALSVIGANFISDLVYGIIDPRIKYE